MWKRLFLWFVFFFAAAAANTDSGGAKSGPLSILLLSPPYSGHIIPMLALAEELVRRKHNVTLVSGSTDFIRGQAERLNLNLWSVGLEGYLDPQELTEDVNRVAGKSASETIDQLLTVSAKFQEGALKIIDNSAVESFDIIAGDAAFSPFLMCFSRKWGIPSVNIWVALNSSPFDIYPWPFPSILTGYSDNLSLYQRFISTVSHNIVSLVLKYTVPDLFAFAGPLCSGVNISLNEMSYFIHHLPQIIVSSFGFEFSRVRLPLTEYVGPMLSHSLPPLPADLAEWLAQRAASSVVYVSMGSTAILTAAEAEAVVNGATQANLSVVWSLRKSNQHILEGMEYDSESVLVADWIPQLALLRHPSVHSAVIHGGLGGVQEALSCGVPTIVVPFFGDQLDNAVRVHHHNYGRIIHRHKLTTALVAQTLRLFDSQLYRTALQRIQRIYRRDGGASRVADLLEFYSEVGYQHLVPAYAKYNWTWVEFYNVDVYTLLALVVLLPTYISYRLIRRCLCTFSKTRKKKTE